MELYFVVRPLLQPIIGAFHGWFATRMVVVMLFRPHKEYYFPITGKKIPFTPGIFPSRKADLARNIGKTVTESLITPEDLKEKAKNVITEDNIFLVVDATIETMISGFKNTDNIQKLANSFSNTIPDIIDSATSNFLDRLANDQNKQLTKLTEYFINDIFLNIKVSREISEKIINYIFESFVSPKNIRISLHDALTPERAANLQAVLRERTTGALKFLLALVNLESLFNNFKEYLKNEPEKSEELIKDIINQLKVKEEFINRITNLDFKKLSFEDVSAIKNNLREGIKNYIKNNKANLESSTGQIKESIGELIHNQIVNFTPSQIKPEMILMIKTEVTKFLYNYLKSDLSNLINRGIQALKPREMIEGKINAYSSQDVENLILGIMKKELKNLEFLGFIIGILLGMSALCVEFFLPYK